MAGLNCRLSRSMHLRRMFDRSGKGSIDIEAFARLHQFLMQMQESFRYFDSERRGSLSFNAVHQALQHAGREVLYGYRTVESTNFAFETSRWMHWVDFDFEGFGFRNRNAAKPSGCVAWGCKRSCSLKPCTCCFSRQDCSRLWTTCMAISGAG